MAGLAAALAEVCEYKVAESDGTSRMPTDAELAGGLKVLDPRLNSLLVNNEVSPALCGLLGFLGVKTPGLLWHCGASAAAFTTFLIDDLKVKNTGIPGKLRIAALLEAWTGAGESNSFKRKLETEQKILGLPRTTPPPTHLALRNAFEAKWPMHLPRGVNGEPPALTPEIAPSPGYIDLIAGRIDEETITAEPLEEVTTLQQWDERPDKEGQHYRGRDGTLSVVPKKLLTSPPHTTLQLQERYALMGKGWTMAAAQDPTKFYYHGFSPDAFVPLQQYILGTDVYKYKIVNQEGKQVGSPTWSACLLYELEVRRESLRSVSPHPGASHTWRPSTRSWTRSLTTGSTS